MEFGNEELFFMIKKLQVVEDFCKNVIEILCEPSNKKYISELSDKYTNVLFNCLFSALYGYL